MSWIQPIKARKHPPVVSNKGVKCNHIDRSKQLMGFCLIWLFEMCAKKKTCYDLLRGQIVIITWNISLNLIRYAFLNAIFIVYDALFFSCAWVWYSELLLILKICQNKTYLKTDMWVTKMTWKLCHKPCTHVEVVLNWKKNRENNFKLFWYLKIQSRENIFYFYKPYNYNKDHLNKWRHF